MGLFGKFVRTEKRSLSSVPVQHITFTTISHGDERLVLNRPVSADVVYKENVIELVNYELMICGSGKDYESAISDFCAVFINVYDSVKASGSSNRYHAIYDDIVQEATLRPDRNTPNRTTRKALMESQGYMGRKHESEEPDAVLSENIIDDGDYLYEVRQTTQFKRDLKTIQKRHYDVSLLKAAIGILANGGILPDEYLDHSLSGDMEGNRECHIRPDWVLVYAIDRKELKLLAIRTGRHVDVFD